MDCCLFEHLPFSSNMWRKNLVLNLLSKTVCQWLMIVNGIDFFWLGQMLVLQLFTCHDHDFIFFYICSSFLDVGLWSSLWLVFEKQGLQGEYWGLLSLCCCSFVVFVLSSLSRPYLSPHQFLLTFLLWWILAKLYESLTLLIVLILKTVVHKISTHWTVKDTGTPAMDRLWLSLLKVLISHPISQRCKKMLLVRVLLACA